MDDLQGNLIDYIKNIDKFFCLSVIILVLVGIFSIYSAGGGASGIGKSLAFRQSIWAVVSIFSSLMVLMIGYKWFMDWAYAIYSVSLFFLVLVLVIGAVTKGAQSWLALGPFHLQPSEFGKVAFALAMSKHMVRYTPDNPVRLAKVTALGIPAIILVLIQPDLGSAAVYSFMLFTGILVAGGINRYSSSLFAGCFAMLPVGWHFLKDYQKLRLTVFLNPSIDPLGAGYNVIQSRIAVGSGGFFGKGYLQGMQSKLHFLPEPHTDFIFSVFAEEFGFIGTLLLIIFLLLVLWRIFNAGRNVRDIRVKYFVVMIAAWLFFQSTECIAMSIGLMPVTGLPFPFISYGGSSLLSIFLSLGIIASIQLSTVKIFK